MFSNWVSFNYQHGSMKIIIEPMLIWRFLGVVSSYYSPWMPCHLWCNDYDLKLTDFHFGRKLVWTNIS